MEQTANELKANLIDEINRIDFGKFRHCEFELKLIHKGLAPGMDETGINIQLSSFIRG